MSDAVPEIVTDLLESRPVANPNLEQFLMLEQSVWQRAQMLKSVTNSSGCLFLGDDDHLSLVYALIGGAPVVVLEIDSRVALSLGGWAARFKLAEFSILQCDLRDQIDLPASPQYFYANPPWSSKNDGHGIRYWISRALDLCSAECTGLVEMPANQEVAWVNRNWLSVQHFLSDNGCRITGVDNEAGRYAGLNDSSLTSVNLTFRRVDRGLKRLELPRAGEALYR